MTADEDQQIRQVVQRLSVKYPHVDPEHVAEAVQHAYAHFDGRHIRDFVPLLVERIAGQQLTTLVAP